MWPHSGHGSTRTSNARFRLRASSNRRCRPFFTSYSQVTRTSPHLFGQCVQTRRRRGTRVGAFPPAARRHHNVGSRNLGRRSTHVLVPGSAGNRPAPRGGPSRFGPPANRSGSGGFLSGCWLEPAGGDLFAWGERTRPAGSPWALRSARRARRAAICLPGLRELGLQGRPGHSDRPGEPAGRRSVCPHRPPRPRQSRQ